MLQSFSISCKANKMRLDNNKINQKLMINEKNTAAKHDSTGADADLPFVFYLPQLKTCLYSVIINSCFMHKKKY